MKPAQTSSQPSPEVREKVRALLLGSEAFRALPQAQEAFFAPRRNSQGHDHHFARVRLGVEEDRGEPLVVEPALGQPLDFFTPKPWRANWTTCS